MALDEQLLNNSQAAASGAEDGRSSEADEDSDSGALREEKRSPDSRGPDGNQTDVSDDLAALKQRERNRLTSRQANEDKKGKEQEAGGAAAKAQTAATGSCLKQAWLNIIPSFGLSVFWINLHVFLRKIGFDKIFGPLGSEWTPPTAGTTTGAGSKKNLSLMEGAGLACLDLGCLLALIMILALIALIVKVVTNPLSSGVSALKYLWEMFTGG